MNTFLGLTVVACVLAVGVPANAQGSYERVCRDSDGDRVPCNYRGRICRDSDGDRVSCGRRYYQGRNNIEFGVPGISLRIGPSRRYYNNWH